MRLLVDMGHPAHVHFFKNAIWELEKRGHEVKITARDKDVTLELLEAYGFEYAKRPSGWRPLNLLKASRFLKNIASEFKADVLTGVHNPYIARAAVGLKKKCILFTDTPGSKMVNRFSVELANVVCTPECLNGRFPNQVTYPGYKEMAYLHPNTFKPDTRALTENGIEDEKYYVVRFIQWDAYHDKNKQGMSLNEKEKLINELSRSGKVLVTSEGNGNIPSPGIKIKSPEHIHSLLKFSSGYIGEGASMAKEAAILGVPSVYVSPLQGLPPIDQLTKEGRIKAIPRYNGQAASDALKSSKGPREMFDVSSEIVKELNI